MTTIEPIQLDWMSAPEFLPPEKQNSEASTSTSTDSFSETENTTATEAVSSVEFQMSELTFVEATREESVTETKETIPAVLCDQKLLEEIASIPNRMAFKIGDVADLLGIKQYVLRYWETEFEVLRPKKAANNQRAYSRKDVENALLIRKLLHRDRFSIEGARSAMKSLKTHIRKEKDQTKDLVQVQTVLSTSQDSIDELLGDVRKLRLLFK